MFKLLSVRLFAILLLSSPILFHSCTLDDSLDIHTAIDEEYNKSSNMRYISLGGLHGREPDCKVGTSKCATQAIIIDWVVLTKAISYVDDEAPEEVVAGASILNSKTIRLRLIYQGRDYAGQVGEDDGNIYVAEEHNMLPNETAEGLGVSAIILQPGSYKIKNRGDQQWSGYADIKAQIIK